MSAVRQLARNAGLRALGALVLSACAPAPPTSSPVVGSASAAAAPVTHRDPAVSIRPPGGGKPVFAWGPDQTLRVLIDGVLETIDRTGARLREERFPIEGDVEEIQIAQDGRRALVITKDAVVWTETERWSVDSTRARKGMTCVVLSPDGARAAASDATGLVHVFGVDGSAEDTVFTGSCPTTWSGDGATLALRKWVSGGEPPSTLVELWSGGGASEPFVTVQSLSAVVLSEDGTRVSVVAREEEAVRTYRRDQGSTRPIRVETHDVHRAPRWRSSRARLLWNPVGLDAVLLPNGVVRRPDARRGVEGFAFAPAPAQDWQDCRVEVGALHRSFDDAPLALAARCSAAAPFRTHELNHVCVWDATTGERRSLRSRAYERTTALVGITRDAAGTVLAAKGADGSVRVWDLERGTLASLLGVAAQHAIGQHDGVFIRDDNDVQIRVGLRRVTVTGKDQPVRVWSAAGGATWRVLPAPTEPFVADARWVVGLSAGDVVARDIDGPAELRLRAVPDALGVEVSPRSDAVVTWNAAGRVEVRALSSRVTDPPAAFDLGGAVARATFTPDGALVDAELVEPDASGRKRVFALARASGAITETCGGGPAFDPGGPTLASIETDLSSCDTVEQLSRCANTVLRTRSRADGACSNQQARVFTSDIDTTHWWEAREVDVDDVQWLRTAAPGWRAVVSIEGEILLTVDRPSARGGPPAIVRLHAMRGVDAALVFTPDGAFDLVGGSAEEALALVFCDVRSAAGLDEPASGQACAGARVPGLLGRVLRGDYP